MLSLSRKEGQSLILQLPDGRDIKIKLVEGGPKWAVIGIQADNDVVIVREELLDAKRKSRGGSKPFRPLQTKRKPDE